MWFRQKFTSLEQLCIGGIRLMVIETGVHQPDWLPRRSAVFHHLTCTNLKRKQHGIIATNIQK